MHRRSTSSGSTTGVGRNPALSNQSVRDVVNVPLVNGPSTFHVNATVPKLLVTPPNLSDFETTLKRYVGGFKKWKAFYYVKRSFFMEEYIDKEHSSGSHAPNAVTDLTHAETINKENCPSEEFCVRFVTGEEIRFMAASVADKSRWVNAIKAMQLDNSEAMPPSFPAALIAPIRRRHTSMSLPRKGSKDLSAMDAARMAQQARRDEPFKMIGTLRLHIMEASDVGANLVSKPSPYAVMVIDGINRGSTQPKHSTTNPFWSQEFFFDEEITHETSTLYILINNARDRKNKRDLDCRLGVVDIDLNQHRHGRTIDQWFVVRPHNQQHNSALKRKMDRTGFDGSIGRSKSTTVGGYTSTAVDEGYGLIRLKLTLTLEKIMPFSEYQPLLEIIVDPKLVVAEAIAKVAVAQLDEAAGTLVNIFALNNRVTDFVRTLTTLEIRKTDRAAIIFRGNTLGTKVIDMYMKMVGLDYLHDTLYSFVQSVVNEKESVEIDPTRLEKGEDIKKNQKRLYQYCDMCFKAIANSVNECPPEMKRVFSNIRNEVIQKFKNGDEQYTSVSGFIFLRFFCPAILNPALFGLVSEQLSGRPARALTLTAKVIQCLANLVPAIDKEPYMTVMLPFLEERQGAMRELIRKFSEVGSNDLGDLSSTQDDRDLSRELSALQRLCVERFGDLKALADVHKDANLEVIFPVLTRLEQRQFDYEKKYAIDFAEKLAAAQAAASKPLGSLAHPRLARILENAD